MPFSWKKLGAICGILGGILFVVITFIAMLTYPGGYNFLLNTFSALGLTEINGQPSLLNYYLFVAACSSAAICLVVFLLAIRTLFTETTRLVVISWIGTILGIVSTPNLAALAIFAGNVFPSQHSLTTQLFFLLISSAVVVYSIGILLNKDYENLYALIGIIIAVICYVYLAGIIIHDPLIGSAAMQKVAVYGLVLWSAFQSIKLLQVFK